jgi:hypothetical protein
MVILSLRLTHRQVSTLIHIFCQLYLTGGVRNAPLDQL